MNKRDKRIVVIGGGTGTFVVLSGLKKYAVDLSAIVTVADSGGSTGRLRDEFGFLPVGDLRQGLAALAVENGQEWIKELLLYRFDKGSGLKGHNLGNLILTALQDMSGSTAKAVEIASKVFRLRGHIYPVTTEDIQLEIEYEDGRIETGEHVLDDGSRGGKKIVNLRTKPRADIYEGSKKAIDEADMIVIGPGDLYGSILPNLIIEGMSQALARCRAKVVYIANLMTRYSQTHNMRASDHVYEVEKRIGRKVDKIILNNKQIPKSILKSYEVAHEFPVEDDIKDSRALRSPLIVKSRVKRQKGDVVDRSYLRHDPGELAKVLINFL
jgi:uncharacterized cofD-like protein